MDDMPKSYSDEQDRQELMKLAFQIALQERFVRGRMPNWLYRLTEIQAMRQLAESWLQMNLASRLSSMASIDWRKDTACQTYPGFNKRFNRAMAGILIKAMVRSKVA